MTEGELVRRCEGALGHGKVIYGIQEIGLALTVIAADAVYIRRELQLLKLYVPEIGYYYLL